jgi:hypothetical protein
MALIELELRQRRRVYNRSGRVDPRVDYSDRTRRERDTLLAVKDHLQRYHRLKAPRIMAAQSVEAGGNRGIG